MFIENVNGPPFYLCFGSDFSNGKLWVAFFILLLHVTNMTTLLISVLWSSLYGKMMACNDIIMMLWSCFTTVRMCVYSIAVRLLCHCCGDDEDDSRQWGGVKAKQTMKSGGQLPGAQ